jgi:hypothetical protein
LFKKQTSDGTPTYKPGKINIHLLRTEKQHAKQTLLGKSCQNLKPAELEEYAPLFGALGRQELIQQGYHHPFEQHQ